MSHGERRQAYENVDNSVVKKGVFGDPKSQSIQANQCNGKNMSSKYVNKKNSLNGSTHYESEYDYDDTQYNMRIICDIICSDGHQLLIKLGSG